MSSNDGIPPQHLPRHRGQVGCPCVFPPGCASPAPRHGSAPGTAPPGARFPFVPFSSLGCAFDFQCSHRPVSWFPYFLTPATYARDHEVIHTLSLRNVQSSTCSCVESDVAWLETFTDGIVGFHVESHTCQDGMQHTPRVRVLNRGITRRRYSRPHPPTSLAHLFLPPSLPQSPPHT